MIQENRFGCTLTKQLIELLLLSIAAENGSDLFLPILIHSPREEGTQETDY